MPSISLRTIREEHASLAAVLHSLRLMLDQGPGDEPAAFFDVMRAMLFYIDEFPERQHHPKESQWLFPRVAERSPQVAQAIAQLERDHEGGEAAVRELQHLLLGQSLLPGLEAMTPDSLLGRFINRARELGIALYLDDPFNLLDSNLWRDQGVAGRW